MEGVVESALKGNNVLVMCNGQTNSGNKFKSQNNNNGKHY